MSAKSVVCTVILATSAALPTAAVAQANPATPMPVIESSAAQLCGYIDRDPSKEGVMAGMGSLGNRGFDEIDGAMVLITAVHHVCPEYKPLIDSIVDPIAAEEICGKQQ